VNLDEAYLDVVDRSLAAADILLAQGHHESAAFYAYHAFESLGAALCASRGVAYPKNSHVKKINVFRATASTVNHPIAYNVNMVAVLVASVRNECLYPKDYGGSGSYDCPRVHITGPQAGDLIRRVKGVLRTLRPYI
jgi:hypothetical protein